MAFLFYTERVFLVAHGWLLVKPCWSQQLPHFKTFLENILCSSSVKSSIIPLKSQIPIKWTEDFYQIPYCLSAEKKKNSNGETPEMDKPKSNETSTWTSRNPAVLRQNVLISGTAGHLNWPGERKGFSKWLLMLWVCSLLPFEVCYSNFLATRYKSLHSNIRFES